MHNSIFTRFKSNSDYIKLTFGERVQKIAINTGYLCPNRDGSKGIGGCTYCNISSIRPDYAYSKKSITEQIKEGIDFFSHKNKTKKYIVYFQSYTNTYQDSEELIKDYQEALSYPNVLGLIIATRPDCLPLKIVEYLSEIAKTKYIAIELGIESTNDQTLLKINRCHTYAETIAAYKLLNQNNLNLGGHIIIGLPGENNEDIINHAKLISKLPLKQLKIHHLQILKHTQMAKEFALNVDSFKLFNQESYLNIVIAFLEYLRPDITIQRFVAESPKDILIAPQWNGLRNRDFTKLVEQKMIELDTWQGKLYSS